MKQKTEIKKEEKKTTTRKGDLNYRLEAFRRDIWRGKRGLRGVGEGVSQGRGITSGLGGRRLGGAGRRGGNHEDKCEKIAKVKEKREGKGRMREGG